MNQQFPTLQLIRWRRWRFVCVIAAIIVHSLYAFLNGPTVDWDYGYQLGSAQQFAIGNGITNIYVTSTQDLSEFEYRPVSWWTPGEAVFVAVLLKLTHDIWWAAYLFDALHISLFFISWFIILEVLKDWISLKTRILIWILWIFIYAPIMSGTDQAAIAWYSISLMFLMIGMQSPRYLILFTVIAGFAGAMTIIFRYAFAPTLVVFPAVWGYYVIRTRQYKLLRLIGWHTLGSGLVLLILGMWFLSWQIKNTLPQTNEVGLFLNQVLALHPFPADSIGMSFGFKFLLPKLNLHSGFLHVILWVCSCIILVRFAIVVSPYIIKPKQSNTIPTIFWIHAVATFLVIVGTNIILTIRYHELSNGWTFGGEARYYGGVGVYLCISTLTIITPNYASITRSNRFLRWVVIGVVFISVGSATVTRLTNIRFLLISSPRYGGIERIESPIYHIINQASKSAYPVVFITGHVFDLTKIRSEVALATGAYFEGKLDANVTLKTRQPITLVIGVPELSTAPADEIAVLQAWTDSYYGRRIGIIQDYMKFYEITLWETTF